jgi:hypothetical protein
LVDAYVAHHEYGHLTKAGAFWNKRVEFLERLLGSSLRAPKRRISRSASVEELRNTALHGPLACVSGYPMRDARRTPQRSAR